MPDFPLTTANRNTLARAFRHHARVDLGIDCVLEGWTGRAEVDDPHQPAVFLLLVSDFFGYLGGNAHHPAAAALVAGLPTPLLLMPGVLDGPDPWLERVRAHYPDRVTPITRYRFSGTGITRDRLERMLADAPYRDRAQQMDAALAGRLMVASPDMINLSGYDSPAEFADRSIGYGVLAGDEVLGVAYGSLACSRGIEVSVVVRPDHRQRGMATTLSALLLRDCLARNIDANWDAANPESCRLALKLGYQPLGSYTALIVNNWATDDPYEQ